MTFHIAERTQASYECPGAVVDRLRSSHFRDRGRGENEAHAVELPRRLRLGPERGREDTGQRRQQKASAVHVAMVGRMRGGGQPPILSALAPVLQA